MSALTPLPTAYWPPVSWFARACQPEQTIILDACEHYQKGGTRNRCTIAGPNGPQRLSIPLEKGKHQQTPIREVRIDNTQSWARLHWRSIQTAYGNAPYFEYYADDVQSFYEQESEYLYDFNKKIILFLLKKFKWTGQIEDSTVFGGPYPKSFAPDDLNTLSAYPQVFSERFGFLPDLSALDLLFCTGPTGLERLSLRTQ
jgi:hypothetical protein